jgi:hypothetical protein
MAYFRWTGNIPASVDAYGVLWMDKKKEVKKKLWIHESAYSRHTYRVVSIN